MKAIQISKDFWIKTDSITAVYNSDERPSVRVVCGQATYGCTYYEIDEFLELIGWKFRPVTFPTIKEASEKAAVDFDVTNRFV